MRAATTGPEMRPTHCPVVVRGAARSLMASTVAQVAPGVGGGMPALPPGVRGVLARGRGRLASSRSTPMIQFFHVYKAYPGDPPVLSDINLNVEKGEFVFLTGPSGAGKTTLLKLIFCAEKATKGQILVGGRNIARIRESAVPYLRRNIGVVFQDFKLLPQRTVEDNVAFTLDVLGVPREEAREKVYRM